MVKSKNIHTSTNHKSIKLISLQLFIKLLTYCNYNSALRLVTKLFCSPIKRPLGAKQIAFYQTGVTLNLTIGTHDIKVLKKGKGPCIYLSHGWNSNGFRMRHLADYLVEQGFTVLIPDLPCHGRSSGKVIDQIEAAKVVKELLLALNQHIKIQHICTHSWGGTVTLLALDMLREENKVANLKLDSIVTISLPSHYQSIIKIFTESLNLNTKLSLGLIEQLKVISQKDNRGLKEAFPIGLDKLMQSLIDVPIMMIHDINDEVISYHNSNLMKKRYPFIKLHITQNNTHSNIIKNKEIQSNIKYFLQKSLNNSTKKPLVGATVTASKAC